MNNSFRIFIWILLGKMYCQVISDETSIPSVKRGTINFINLPPRKYNQDELLDNHLVYYEPLLYDFDDLHLRHTQVGKSAEVLQFEFYAYNRNFSLELKRNHLSSNIILHHKKEITTPDLSFVYTGKDTDYLGSEARLAVINGTVQGKVVLPGDTIYHIAPSSLLFKTLPHFHTVIYSEKDYVWNHTFHLDSTIPIENQSQNLYNTPRNRQRRELKPSSNEQAPRVCTVKLTTDKTVWQYFMNIDQNEDRSRYDIIFMMINHVARANDVFRNTEFTLHQGKEIEKKLKGIQFEIRKIKIMTDKDCTDTDKSALCYEDLDGLGLLNQFSNEENNIADDYYSYYDSYDNMGGDHDYYYDKPEELTAGDETEKEFDVDDIDLEYCLSFLITARVLYINKGSPLLGRAFGATKGADKGVCSKQNNGFITLFLESPQALPSLVTELVFTHEIAHAFGAKHDNTEECSEFGLKEEPSDGYYLMHTISQRGDKPNHHKLSPCSIKYISEALSRNESRFCFTDSELPYCGNGIVDDGEECDCGDDCDTDIDNCCHSHNVTVSLRCTLKSEAQCSPSQGPCCDGKVCRLINRTEVFVCQNKKPCVDEIYCYGEMYGTKCPPPDKSQQREDGFICSRNGRVCDAGSCNASICKLIQWRECQISNNKEKLTIQEKEDLCFVGCRKRRSDECISSNDMHKLQQHPEFLYLLSNISSTTILPIQLPPGTPCNRNTGYCDVFYRCRGVYPDSPLAKLGACLASGKCGEQLLYILRVYWWAVTLCSIGGIILLWLFAKCCAVHTKSSNPEVELRHPHRSVRQSVTSVRDTVIHPHQTFRSSVKSVQGSMRSVRGSLRSVRGSISDSFRRKNGRPGSCELDLNQIDEELEVLNNNPSANDDDDVFL